MNRLLRWLGCGAAALVLFMIVMYSNRGTLLTLVLDSRGLSEPFVGVTTNGSVRRGLFPIKRSGADTTEVLSAARAFLDSLGEEANAVKFPVDSDEWQRWSNIHLYDRQGVALLDMSERQKTNAYGLMSAGLSERGYAQARDIMRLDTTLGELKGGDFEWYGEERFWFTIMGEPHGQQPWGWQVDGHHLVINYFVLGDQVVMSPVFLGAEPVIAPSGVHEGVAVLQDEQNEGLAMVLALTESQRAVANISASKPGNNNRGEFYSDNVVVPNTGLNVGSLDAAQLSQFLALIRRFVGNLADDLAEVKMTEVVQHLDETYFTWVGPTSARAAYYYRIMSPVIMIEFDHQRPVGLSHLTEDAAPQRNHIHVVIRTPNGNDYGKDLLRQHLAQPHETSEVEMRMRDGYVAQQASPDRG